MQPQGSSVHCDVQPCLHHVSVGLFVFRREGVMCWFGSFFKLDAPGSQLFARMDELYLYIRDQFLPTYIEIVHIWMKHPHGIVGR
jgi:hypothetical protein